MQGGERDIAKTVASVEPVLGLLDCAQRSSGVGRRDCAVFSQTSGNFGFSSQSGQIGVNTQARVHIPGIPFFPQGGDSEANRGKVVKITKNSKAVSQGRVYESKGLAINARAADGHGENGSVRYAQDEIIAEISGSELVTEDRLTRSHGSRLRRGETVDQVVGRERQCYDRSTSPSCPAAGACVRGRLAGRVGGTSRGYFSDNQGQVVGGRQEVTHQSVGVEGNLASFEALRVSAGGSVSVDRVGQLYSGGVHKQTGRYEIGNASSFDSGSVRVGNSSTDYA